MINHAVLTVSLKDHARKSGADLVGITPAERLEGAPEGFRPADILQGARSVVVLASRMPNSLVEEKRETSYVNIMFNIYDRLDTLAYLTACFLEESGFRAIPVPARRPFSYFKHMTGRGDLSHKHAAQAAGLGEIGMNSLLSTPKFGDRVQLVSLVTNALLTPDAILVSPLCDRCIKCVQACPVGAIKDGRVDQTACRQYSEKTLPIGSIVYSCWKCRRVCRTWNSLGK